MKLWNRTSRAVGTALAGLAAMSMLTACVGGSATPEPGGASGGSTTLHLVGFAVPKEANNAIQKKFAETPDGQGVVWEESYGASGDQSRAVVNGLKADYVNFSLEGDVTRLVKAGLVAEDWKSGPDQGHRLRLRRRDRGAQGQPAGHQGLGRPAQAGRQDHHARTRPPRARPGGTSWPPTSRSSPTAAPRPTPRST